jgi:hypothetical protein
MPMKKTAAKKVMEKKTGESYASKGAMKMHESKEGMKQMKMEYGAEVAAKKAAAKKTATKKTVAKKSKKK